MNIQFHSSIESIQKDIWDRLCGTNYPFLNYLFLAALEHSQCTSTETGWQPHHLSISDNGKLVAVMPLYIKQHSYGEYVFDWAWADAYHQHGLDYYPKLVNAIPFTPATGPRLGLDESIELLSVLPTISQALKTECERLGASSWHCLFPENTVSDQLIFTGASQRMGHQYHWLNQGYQDFGNFLEHFTSRKRKSLRKERAKVVEQGIQLVKKEGAEILEEEWELFYQFYHLTYFKRSGRQGYLNHGFFQRLAKTFSSHIVMSIAYHGTPKQMVAGALFFKDDKNLYGRYWGCSHEFEFLHFEACYYQGIEYAIANNLQRFDPGAQGEHKIQRGFTPVSTRSNHWIARDNFREAVDRFLIEEAKHNNSYLQEAQTRLPFKHLSENH